MPGLDVSSYQGHVNWSRAAANGAKFAAVKATEGTYYRSPDFAQQYNGSYNAGLERGAYHFAIPSNSTGPAQADYFVAHGGAWSANGRTLPGELDIEYNPYSGGECYGLSKSQMVNWISSFDGEYAALTGRRPIIYTTTDWWRTCTGNARGFTEPLWIANYGGTPYPLPASWTRYTAWQYADHGTYPGDQDVFNGDHARLVAFARGGSHAASPSLTPGTTPGAAQDSSGNELAAVTASDGSVQVVNRSPSGAFTSETDIGGVAKGGPAVASAGAGAWDALVRGSDNAAWLNTYRNGAWSGWSSLGGRLSARPGAAASGQTATALARGADGALYRRPVSGGGWTRLGGRLASGAGPSGAYGSPGRLTAVVQGTDGSVWIYNGAWWSLGSPTAGGVTQEPGASSIRPGEVEIFARSYADNAAWHRWWNATSGWSRWYSLGGDLTSGPATAAHQGTTRSDVQELYALGTDNNRWAVTDAKGAWGTWTRVP